MVNGTFFFEWMKAPVCIGSIAPSGRRLASLVTQELEPEMTPIIELGAGTGAVTLELIASGINEGSLTLVEQVRAFAETLELRFPKARICLGDAANSNTISQLPVGTTGAVVSGLPMLNMSTEKIRSVLLEAFLKLRPNGKFYQFSYLPRCPVPAAILRDIGLRSRYLGMALLNIPPAFVYRIERHP